MTFNPTDLLAIIPEMSILSLAILVIMIEVLITRSEETLQGITAIGLLAVMAVSILVRSTSESVFSGMVANDDFTMYLKVLLTGIALLAVLMSRDYLKGLNFRVGEYYTLILLATVGMMVLSAATDLVTMFLGIETMSIALYALAGFRSENSRSNESALKYFLLGAFSTGFLLYGIALLYGATGGKTNFADIGTVLVSFGADNPAPMYLYAGIGLIMVGLLFKVAAVPFHFWSPDVYQGAPTPITAFMSAGPKAAAIIVFLRFFGWALPDMSAAWQPILGIVAAVTMVTGNIIALSQQNIKRMLAYSSISHAGYLLLAVIAAGSTGIRNDAAAGMFFYLVAYYLMNMGAFTVAILVSRAREDGDYQINNYQGLAATHPWIAGAMALFMISLTGIPPTAGFFGKLYVFSAAVKAGFIPLVVVGVLASAVSAFYYLRIVVYMYMRPETQESSKDLKPTPAWTTIMVVCSFLIIYLGIMPGIMMKWADSSARNISSPSRVVSLK